MVMPFVVRAPGRLKGDLHVKRVIGVSACEVSVNVRVGGLDWEKEWVGGSRESAISIWGIPDSMVG